MKKVIFLSMMVLVSGVLLAQNYAFQVIAFKGKVLIGGQPAKVGLKVMSDQKITVADGAYLGMAHKSGKTYEITNAGEYTVSNLEAALMKINSGNAYVAMVVNELTGNSAEVNRKPKTGSVERDLGKEPIGIMLDKQTIFYPGKPIAISWYMKDNNFEKMVEGDQFRVTISNFYGEEVYSTVTSNRYVIVNLDNVKFDQQNKALTYRVTSVKNPKKIISIEGSLVQPEEPELSKVAEELKSSDYGDTPLQCLGMANFFEENGLYANAQAAYLRAIEIGGSEIFTRQYEAFLDRNMFSKKARLEKK